MGNIGGEIATGAASALFDLVIHIPLTVWLILMGGVVIFGFLMRYLTNWKVDAFIVLTVVGLSTIVYYRQHWIDQGYNEALAKVKAAETQVAGYKSTNGLITACYEKNISATYLWDRTQGKCLRADGAVE
jgi:hypothetical protein